MRIPIEKYYHEEDQESFKVPKEFTIHVKGSGYTAFVKSFAIFFSDIETDTGRFAKTTKKFKDIQTLEQAQALGLPILQQYIEPSTQTTIIEFDLSQRAQIKEALDVKTLQLYPLLLIIMNNVNYISADVVYQIKQHVAAKFINMRLI